MKKKKNINQELEKLASIYESGGGYGDPDAKAEHDRKFQLLMHQQNLEINKRNIFISMMCAVATIVNIAVFVYQVFWR